MSVSLDGLINPVNLTYEQRGLNSASSVHSASVCTVEISANWQQSLAVEFIQQTCTSRFPVSPNKPLPKWKDFLYRNFVNVSLVWDTVSTYTSDDHWTGCESAMDSFFLNVDFVQRITLKFVVASKVVPYTLKISVTPHPLEEKPKINVQYITTLSGYIQGQVWTNLFLDIYNRDEWASITLPSGYHHLMISFRFLILKSTCCGRRHCTQLELYVGGNSTGNLVWTGCGSIPPYPTVYRTHELHVHYTGSSAHEPTTTTFKGYRLSFSFHKTSALPELLPSGKWNCSVPHLPDFRQHLRCNLLFECAGGEDERGCGYHLCDPEGVVIGGRCYSLHRPVTEIMWGDASQKCRSLGGYLASPNTMAEVGHFEDTVKHFLIANILLGDRSSSVVPEIYGSPYLWEDNSVVYFPKFEVEFYSTFPRCGILSVEDRSIRQDKPWQIFYSCAVPRRAYYFCETDLANQSSSTKFQNSKTKSVKSLLFPVSANKTVRKLYFSVAEFGAVHISTVQCPSGHVTHTFLACDENSQCFFRRDHRQGICAGRQGGSMTVYDGDFFPDKITSQTTLHFSVDVSFLRSYRAHFPCSNDAQRVPYTLVCDFRLDCTDGSDELFCVFPPCPDARPFHCGNKQCYSEADWCNNKMDCVNGADEAGCSDLPHSAGVVPPAIIEFTAIKKFWNIWDYSSTNFTCPESHFLCPGADLCVPVYMRCNGVYDCQGQEDEEECDSYSCPGFYRCRASTVCLHVQYVCDGLHHCPQHDDELLCDSVCPQNCTCVGLSFRCHAPFPATRYTALRYLDARGSGVTLEILVENHFLIYLSLAQCGLTHLVNTTLPNLRHLDLSDNQLGAIRISHLKELQNLQVLILAGNPLMTLFQDYDPRDGPALSVTILDLSHVLLTEFDGRQFVHFKRLRSLNLSGSGIDNTLDMGFQLLAELRELDLRGCPVSLFSHGVFQELHHLHTVYADNYKLCCPAVLPPGFSPDRCHATFSEVSSCDALLRTDFYRAVLSVFAVLALTTNLAAFVYRVFVSRSGHKLGFGVFVTHLCVSDGLMGVYLAVIGVADRMYQGSYIWQDTQWRHSVPCTLAGFTSLVSNEVSTFIICLVTLDRFIVLRFPFTHIRFHRFSAHVACGMVWVIGLVLAAIPLLPATAHWGFYSNTGICLPLPITRREFGGHSYAYGIFTLLNMALFLLIAVGQLFIYASIRANRMQSSDSRRQSQDVNIARRLITVVMSDFLCWFPIGLLGLLSSQGIRIPGEVNVGMAICVLPLNSALNPFLYTMNIFLQRQGDKARQEFERKMLDKLGHIQQEQQGCGVYPWHSVRNYIDNESWRPQQHIPT